MRWQLFSNLIVLIFGIALIFGEQAKFGVIDQIATSITTYDNEIQLRIQWNDTIKEDWNYNVIVTADNTSECKNSPCGEYGIPNTIKEVNLPKERAPYLEYKDCIILPGCSYNIKIESSNGKVSNNKVLRIPYCVDDVCSCRHTRDFPKVNMTSEITSNNTITMSWTISLLDKNGFPRSNKTFADIYDQLELNKIYISISEQTNPSLTWGGKHRLIEQKEYPIRANAHSLALGLIQGSARFKVKQQLYPESRYQIRTHVVDKKRCDGPPSHFMLQMPQHTSELKKMGASLSLSMRIGIIVLSCLFVSGIVIFATVYFKRRRSKKNAKNAPHNNMFAHFGINISPETMQDNILYVDKDIEDAQAKGLADIFEVPHTALCIGQEIGVGAFGRVFKATAKNILRMRGTTIVAVKQLKANPTSDEIQEFLTEINMLKGVGLHRNIVSFLGCCTIRPPYMMVMEFVGRGDLLDYLRTVRKRVSVSQLNQTSCADNSQRPDMNNLQKSVKYIELKIATNSEMSFESEDDHQAEEHLRPSVTETMYTALSDGENYVDDEEPFIFDYILDHTELHQFALQIANGMQFLEEQQITHRDLAARNVLIDDRKTLKISDFGLSRHGIYTNTKTRKLPLRWLSIEAIRDNIYSNKSDVWAFAVVLWEIGTLGASPYPTISNNELIPFLVSGQRLEKPQICTDQVYELMMHCWHEDPLLRPTFAEVYQKLQPKTVYVDISSISDDYVFPPIQDKS